MHLLAILLFAAALNTNIKLPNGKVLSVEVATTPEELGRGLIGRNSVPPDSGILLVYPGDITTKYNLMGYPAPMDILFIDENKTIVNLRENAAPCKTADCGYHSIWQHRYALQVPAGFVKRYNLHAGDVLSFDLPSPPKTSPR
jgi:hypothetical protein